MIPEVIYIETTNFCNANCIMCPHDRMKRKKIVMEDSVFHKIISGMAGIDLSNTQLFLHKEGEPLCDNNIAERINYVCKKLPKVKEVGINTNAMLLTETITEKLLNSGLNLIFFSVDGTSKETYDAIRINCHYDTVEKNIKYFLKERKRQKKNIRVVMQMLLTDDTKKQKEKYIEKWEKYNVEFYFKEMHCYLDGGNSTFVEPDFSKQIRCCTDPFRIIVYYADGSVGACCWDYNNEFVIGDARELSLNELFNGERIAYLRKKQQELECRDIKPCNRCGRVYGYDKISEY